MSRKIRFAYRCQTKAQGGCNARFSMRKLMPKDQRKIRTSHVAKRNQPCPRCGHTLYLVMHRQLRKDQHYCNCLGYDFKHNRGFGSCEKNPNATEEQLRDYIRNRQARSRAN